MSQLARASRTVINKDTGIPVAGANITIYREGATVTSPAAGTAPLNLTVRDTGKLVVGDTVFIGTDTGTTFVVNAISSRTAITLGGFAGTFSVASGARLVPINTLPTLYSDDQGGGSTSNPLTTSSKGLAECYIEYAAYDYIVSGGGITPELFEGEVFGTEAPGQIRYADAFASSDSTTGGIQEAHDDLPSTGGLIILSGHKTYSYSTAISISTPDVTIVGAGDSTLLQCSDSTGVHCFDVTADRFTLRDCKIDGRNATLTNGRGVFIEDTYNDATIERVTFLNTPDAAIGGWITNARIKVRDCKIYNPGDSGSTDGFGVVLGTAASFCEIVDNYIDAGNASAIYIGLGSTDCIVTGNTCLNGSDNGIRVGVTRGVIANNICTGFASGSSKDGFRLDLTDSVVANNISRNNTGSGFKITSATNVSIANNQVLENANNGIYMTTANMTGVKIHGNVCKSNTGRGIGALLDTIALTKCSIVGNTCESNSFSGISLDNGAGTTGTLTDCLIANNYCKTNTLKGIYIAPNASGANAWTNIIIQGNALIGNTQPGLQVDAHGVASTIQIGHNYYQGNSVDKTLSGTNWTYIFYQPQKKGTDIAAAATISIPNDGNVFHITGATNITNGITVNAWDNGREVTLIFDSTPTVSDTGTSVLATNFVATTSDTLTIICDGTNWYQKSSSAN